MKQWQCNNQCKSNCCSGYFLPLTPKQKESFEKNGYFKATPKYADWRWLKLHKSVEIVKSHVIRTIYIDKDNFKWQLLHNPVLKTDMLHVDDKCTKLLQNDRCAIYRIRPQACRTSDCPVYSKDKLLDWYAKYSHLKNVRKKAQMQKV